MARWVIDRKRDALVYESSRGRFDCGQVGQIPDDDIITWIVLHGHWAPGDTVVDSDGNHMTLGAGAQA